MGTNYYLKGKHLGKCSFAGQGTTNFLWAGTDDLPTPKLIINWILATKGKIINEYGEVISKTNFFEKIARDESGCVSQRVNFAKGFC